MPLTPAQAIAQLVTDQSILHSWINGPAAGVGSTVSTDAGDVPTMASIAASGAAGGAAGFNGAGPAGTQINATGLGLGMAPANRLDIKITDLGMSFISFNYNGTAVGSVNTDGTTTAFNTSSDQRLKKNIVDAPDAGAIIDKLRVRSWDWKSNGSHQAYGFVAQEEATAYAPAVTAGDDNPSSIKRQWSRDDSKLVPLLVKEIQSLRARIAALEAKTVASTVAVATKPDAAVATKPDAAVAAKAGG